MSDTKILLADNTSNEEKCNAANNIIVNYELPLSTEQILLANEKVRDWISDKPNRDYFRYNREFLFNEVLNINKNMYIALILALYEDYKPDNLHHFINFGNYEPNGSLRKINIGLNINYYPPAIKSYCKLLDYCEFDVTNIQNISEEDKFIIQKYRFEKYSGKLTKCATK